MPKNVLNVIALAVLLIGAAGDRRSLTEAARKGDRESIRTLLKQGVKVDAAEGDNEARHGREARRRIPARGEDERSHQRA